MTTLCVFQEKVFFIFISYQAVFFVLSKNSEIPRINGDENVDVLSYKKFTPEKNQNSNSGSWQNRLSQILSQSSDSSESGLNFNKKFEIFI